MTHHMLEGFDRGWIAKLTNAFLIRAPETRAGELRAQMGGCDACAHIGFVEQGEIFDEVADRTGRAPPVIDADDVLADPRACSRACARPRHSLRRRDARWPKGPKPSTASGRRIGTNAAWNSTGFEQTATRAAGPCPIGCAGSPMQARPIYEELRAQKPAASGSAHLRLGR